VSEVHFYKPDWVLFEAAKRSGWDKWRADHLLRCYLSEHPDYGSYRALCDMIERYEQPPVDRKLLCAREAVARMYVGEPEEADIRYGHRDEYDHVICSKRAIELYEGGFGK
jgi:hypothetical protein